MEFLTSPKEICYPRGSPQREVSLPMATLQDEYLSGTLFLTHPRILKLQWGHAVMQMLNVPQRPTGWHFWEVVDLW
jgi:hypothetical protein